MDYDTQRKKNIYFSCIDISLQLCFSLIQFDFWFTLRKFSTTNNQKICNLILP